MSGADARLGGANPTMNRDLGRRRAGARRMMLWAAGAALGVAVAASPTNAHAIDHCGSITRNEVWSPFDNPHIVTCDVVVRNSTLTLEPGTNVQLAEGVSLIFAAGSKLEAAGTTDMPLTIIGATRTQEAGFWGQIRLEEGSLLGRLEYASVVGGGAEGVPMVEVLGEGVDMAAVTFRLTEGPPLAFRAGALGPSLARAGSASVGRCEIIDFSALGESFIDIRADQDIDVTAEATWSHFCLPYRVDDTIAIGGPDEPTLTLNQGVGLHFADGTELIAGVDAENPGQINLNGSLDEPVVLTGQAGTPGSWGGVTLSEHGFGSFLISARIERGGSGGRSMLIVEDPNASAIDIVVAEAAAYPIELPASVVGTFFAGLYTASEPVVQDNAIDRVLVDAGADVDIARSAAWGRLGVPFEIEGDLVVAGDPAPVFALLSGAELRFGDGEGLTIGDDTAGAGGFEVRASAEVPAVLTSDEDRPGSWRGVRLVAAPASVLIEGLSIANGGQGGVPMFEWGQARGAVTRSTFMGAEGYPLAIPLSSITAIVGEELTVPTNVNRFQENGVDRILVRSDGPFSERRSTWTSPGAPIEFDGSVVIAGPSVPVVELHGGLDIRMPAGSTFTVGGTRDTRAAVRVFDDPRGGGEAVAFRPVDGTAGWSGVRVVEGSTFESRSETSGVVVYGPVDAGAAAIGVESGASITLDAGGGLFGEDGEGIGLHVTGGGAAELHGFTITGHAIGALAGDGGRYLLDSGWVHGNREFGARNDDPAICVTANLIWWGDAAGPNDPSEAPDGCMDAANESGGDRVSDDVDWSNYAIDDELTPVGGIVGDGKKIYMPVAYAGS